MRVSERWEVAVLIKRASGYHYLDVPVSNTRDYSEDRLFFRQITQILPNMKTVPPSQAERLNELLILNLNYEQTHNLYHIL